MKQLSLTNIILIILSLVIFLTRIKCDNVRRPTSATNTSLTPESIPVLRLKNSPASFSKSVQHPKSNSGIKHSSNKEKNDKNLKKLRPQCNKNGMGTSFCIKVDNYPVEAVLKAMQQNRSKFEALFGEDLVPKTKIQTEKPNRTPSGSEFGEESLCQSRERLIFPQAGLTKDNDWSFIINHANYTQGVRVEECVNPGRSCSMSENFPIGYKTECKQKYIYRQLLSINENAFVKQDLFQLPSCCKCYIKKF